MVFKSIALAATTLVLSTSTIAAITDLAEGTWLNTGDITIDASTGLEWLDLTVTYRLPYDPNGEFTNMIDNVDHVYVQNSNWRWATEEETLNLFQHVFFNFSLDNAGTEGRMTDRLYPEQGESLQGVDVLVNLLGAVGGEYVGDGFISGSSYGYSPLFSSPDSFCTANYVQPMVVARIGYVDREEGYSTLSADMASSCLEGRATSNSGSLGGAFLVRASVVPVPTAVWLFISGLIGLIGVARRKKV